MSERGDTKHSQNGDRKHTSDKNSWRVKANEIKNQLDKLKKDIKILNDSNKDLCITFYNLYKTNYDKLLEKWNDINSRVIRNSLPSKTVKLYNNIEDSFERIDTLLKNLCSEFDKEKKADTKTPGTSATETKTPLTKASPTTKAPPPPGTSATGGKLHSKRTKTKKSKKSSKKGSKKGGVGLASMLMPQGLNPLLATVGLAALAKSKKTKKSLSKVAKTAKKDVKKVVRKTGKVAKKVAKSAKKVVRKTGKVAKKVAKTAKKDVKKVAKSAKKVVRKTGKVAKKVAKSAKKVVRKTKK